MCWHEQNITSINVLIANWMLEGTLRLLLKEYLSYWVKHWRPWSIGKKMTGRRGLFLAPHHFRFWIKPYETLVTQPNKSCVEGYVTGFTQVPKPLESLWSAAAKGHFIIASPKLDVKLAPFWQQALDRPWTLITPFRWLRSFVACN